MSLFNLIYLITVFLQLYKNANLTMNQKMQVFKSFLKWRMFLNSVKSFGQIKQIKKAKKYVF